MALKDNIFYRRKKLGLTLEELALKVGISKQTAQKYEKGIITNIPSDKIEKIADALGCSPAYLMGWEKEEPTSTQEDTTDDPYANVSPRVAAELRKLKEMGITGDEPGEILAFGGFNIDYSTPRSKAEVEKIKQIHYEEFIASAFEQINEHNKKAIIIGYDDNGNKSDIFLNEQESRVILTLIKSLRIE